MNYNELKLGKFTKGSRPGRGISAGQGKTAGRGTKGQGSRTGKKLRPGFEGGQTPLARRLPKLRGFTHAPNVLYQEVKLSDLAKLKAKTVTAESLAAADVIKYAKRPVKLLATGTIDIAVTITVDAATVGAIAAIEKAGGTVKLVEKKPKKSFKRVAPEVTA